MPGSAPFHKVFFAAYGFGPYECFFCRQPMTFREMSEGARFGCIHHIDGDRDNNHPYNLTAAHHACHNGWHNAMRIGTPRVAAMQELLRTINVGRKLTPEHRAAISWRGRKHTVQTRAKMSRSAHLRKLTDEQQREIRSLCEQGWVKADVARAYGVTKGRVGQLSGTH